jgi:hypothetical protein
VIESARFQTDTTSEKSGGDPGLASWISIGAVAEDELAQNDQHDDGDDDDRQDHPECDGGDSPADGSE